MMKAYKIAPTLAGRLDISGKKEPALIAVFAEPRLRPSDLTVRVFQHPLVKVCLLVYHLCWSP